MWVRRLLLVPVLLGLAALAAYLYFFYEAPPDARLACYYGAYDMGDGETAVITPLTSVQSLRIVFMDGRTDRLVPAPGQADSVPRSFVGTQGWIENAPPRSAVTFGGCEDGAMTYTADGRTLSGRKQTFDVTETTFDSHGLKLFGRLVMPRVEGAVPVAVLVHGSERSSGVVFNRLQYLLPANGIGVFVYDKRGTGQSEGRYTQDFDLLADDAAAAIETARALAGDLASEVGLQGGSQAGWIEPLAAMKTKTDFVLVGFGFAESPLAEDREEVFDDLRTAGYGDDVIAKAREITDATGRVVTTHFEEGYEELDAVREKYRNEPWFEHAKGEYTGTLLTTPNWILRIVGPFYDVGTPMAHDPVPSLLAYEGPHLWVLAGRDSVAPSANTLRILREIQATRPNLDIVLFPKADHGIIDFEEKDGARIETGFSDGYFRLMVRWLLFKETSVDVEGPVVYLGKDAAAPSADP